MKDELDLSSRTHRLILPLPNRLDGGFGKNRVASNYGCAFDGSARGYGRLYAHDTANPNALQVFRVFWFNPVNNFPLLIFGLSVQCGRKCRR